MGRGRTGGGGSLTKAPQQDVGISGGLIEELQRFTDFYGACLEGEVGGRNTQQVGSDHGEVK